MPNPSPTPQGDVAFRNTMKNSFYFCKTLTEDQALMAEMMALLKEKI